MTIADAVVAVMDKIPDASPARRASILAARIAALEVPPRRPGDRRAARGRARRLARARAELAELRDWRPPCDPV